MRLLHEYSIGDKAIRLGDGQLHHHAVDIWGRHRDELRPESFHRNGKSRRVSDEQIHLIHSSLICINLILVFQNLDWIGDI